jgi:hypothetical protein
MTTEEAVRTLEREWDLDVGFLGRLRQGEFDTGRFERLENLLKQLPTRGDMLDARLVALTWYIPLFMTWQREGCLANGCDPAAFDRAVNRATSLVEEALGVP